MMIGSPDYGYNVNMHDIQEHEQPDDIDSPLIGNDYGIY
jgi:hypothetical protein